MTPEMIAGARTSLPAGGGNHFDASSSGRATGRSPSPRNFGSSHSDMLPQGKEERVVLRIGPPKSPERNSKGNSLGTIYLAINVPPYTGSIRPTFRGPGRVERKFHRNSRVER